MITNDQPTSFLLERQDEDTTNRIKISRLRDFLRNLPGLGLSEKGPVNVCQRFSVTDAELSAALVKLQRPNGPSADLPGLIGTPVARTSKGSNL
jgi:hypothetical protein